MSLFKEITPQQITSNLFEMIGSDYMLIAAKSQEKVNMMTASWGGTGVLWNKPVIFAFIRPQRYTRELIDNADGFSCTFYEKQYQKQLQMCGTKTGRTINKVEECGFNVLEDNNVPYFSQASTVFLCRKLHMQTINPAGFIEPKIEDFYPNKDYHNLYIAEIYKAYVKE